MELISGDTEEVLGVSTVPVAKRLLSEESTQKELIDWQITDLDSASFKVKFSLEQDDSLLSAENNMLNMIFEDGENYLIG